jgi:hypothetical protein
MNNEKMTDEFRTVDESGMLVRVIEYMSSGPVGEEAGDAKGEVAYVYRTEDGEECDKTEDGDFVEITTGRKLQRVRS